jgi:hypothetical protein
MLKKRIIVLANSWKHSGRCIAGREIVHEGEGYRLGGWVRPISGAAQQGELTMRDIMLSPGRTPEILSAVEVSLGAQHGDATQPENWHLMHCPLRDLSSDYARPDFDLLIEEPENLWLQPGMPTDRIEHEELLRHPPARSICCIQPDKLTLAFWTTGALKQKRRARFEYRGVRYDLAMTDPLVSDRHCDRFPLDNEPPVEIGLDPRRVLLCVSLARDYLGHHFKVVAMVLEQEAARG